MVLHIGLKALTALSTPQTDFTQIETPPFLRAGMTNEQMIGIIERFQALERNKNDGSFGSDIHQTVALLDLLIQVAPAQRRHRRRGHPATRIFSGSPPFWTIFRDNLAEPLTLDQIAGKFFISKHYLCRVFKSATGFSVMEYIIYSRVLRARQLLRRGSACSRPGSCPDFPTISLHPHLRPPHRHLSGPLCPGVPQQQRPGPSRRLQALSHAVSTSANFCPKPDFVQFSRFYPPLHHKEPGPPPGSLAALWMERPSDLI